MAIDLPPPIEPVLAPLEQVLVPSISEDVIDYRGILIHIVGPRGTRLDTGTHAVLAKRVLAEPDISGAVRLVANYFALSGVPAAITRYAVSGPNDLHIHVAAGHVERLDGPPDLKAGFASVVHAAPLTEAEFEAARVLADPRTERAALRYRPQFRVLDQDGVALDFGTPIASCHRTSVLADFGNYGNRYAGPYLADLALRQSFASGDEVTIAGTTSVRLAGLGGANSEPYHGGTLGWSKVTPLGVFSANGRIADFSQRLQGANIDGRIDGGTLGWLYPLYADYNQRFNVETKFDRNHERLTASAAGVGGAAVASETYNSAELSFHYVDRTTVAGHALELTTDLALRQGIGSGSSAETRANLSYFALRPSLGVRLGVDEDWTIFADATAQLGGSTVPQLEQFVIGGPSSVHAYQSGAGVGDSGQDARLGIEWKSDEGSVLERYGIRPRLFVEYGSSLLKGDGVSSAQGRVEIADVGAESDIKFTSWLAGSLSVAQSIHERGAEYSGSGLAGRYFFFRLIARY